MKGIFIGLVCAFIFGLAGWCVAFEPLWGLRKLRSHVELQSLKDSAKALATEQKRHVHPDLAMIPL